MRRVVVPLVYVYANICEFVLEMCHFATFLFLYFVCFGHSLFIPAIGWRFDDNNVYLDCWAVVEKVAQAIRRGCCCFLVWNCCMMSLSGVIFFWGEMSVKAIFMSVELLNLKKYG